METSTRSRAALIRLMVGILYRSISKDSSVMSHSSLINPSGEMNAMVWEQYTEHIQCSAPEFLLELANPQRWTHISLPKDVQEISWDEAKAALPGLIGSFWNECKEKAQLTIPRSMSIEIIASLMASTALVLKFFVESGFPLKDVSESEIEAVIKGK